MKIRYLLLIIVSLFLFISPVNAEACDSEDIARLKNIADHVDIAYTFETELDKYGIAKKDRYIIELSNLSEELYAVDIESYDNISFIRGENNTAVIKNIPAGQKEIALYSTNCQSKIKTIKISLLYHNDYYFSEYCDEIQDTIPLCKEWTKQPIDLNDLIKNTEKYKKGITKEPQKNIIDLILDYSVIGIIFIIVLIFVVRMINKKRNNLE